jgi:hypothetical protein
MSRTDVDDFIKNKILSNDMYMYKSADFEGFGRALGYGTENTSENKPENPSKNMINTVPKNKDCLENAASIDDKSETIANKKEETL